ncbi:helix-turn-helix domain-containing protein [Desulfosporosinus sp. BICA1-9]
MYIHRNTLVHRVNKIEKIISADLDDPETRLHILISYKLLEG